MGTEALKTTVVTNLDANPVVYATVARGAPGRVQSVDGYLTVTTAKDAGSTYQLCRVKSTVKLKHVYVGVDATVTTFANDIGFYYSTSDHDGTPKALQGTAVNTTSGSQLLGAAVDLKTVGLVDYIKNMTAAKRDLPLWSACGLTVDPGGYMDLVLVATSTSSGAPVVYAEIQFHE